MNFMKLSTGAAVALGMGLLGLPAANANVILTYTGNDFTSVSGPYTKTDKVTASITLANPLGDNLNLAPVTPLAFSLSDGVQTITGPSSSLLTTFGFSTDAMGDITQWDVDVKLLTGLNTFINTDDSIFAVSDTAGSGTGNSASVSGAPGAWAVPAPPLSNLAALGVLGLAFFWRRRRQILDLVRYSTQP